MYMNMGIYSVKRAKIIDMWNDLDIFNDGTTTFIKIKLYNQYDTVKKVHVDNFGWLQNYLLNLTPDTEYTKDDIIGKDIYVVFNQDDIIECFGKDINSERMQDIIQYNHYQKGSEQSKMTP